MLNGGPKTTSGSSDVVGLKSQAQNGCRRPRALTKRDVVDSSNNDVNGFAVRRRPTLPSNGHVIQSDVTPTGNGAATVGCFSCISRRQANKAAKQRPGSSDASNRKPVVENNRKPVVENGRKPFAQPSNGDVTSAEIPSKKIPMCNHHADSNGNLNFKYSNVTSSNKESSSPSGRQHCHGDEISALLCSNGGPVASSWNSVEANSSSFVSAVPSDGSTVSSDVNRSVITQDRLSGVNLAVRSASREGILRPSLVRDVNQHGNHYVIDNNSFQQVYHQKTCLSPCELGTVPLSVAVSTSATCRRRAVSTSSTYSDNLNKLNDCCRLSPETMDCRNSPATSVTRYNDVKLEDEHRLIARYVDRLSTINGGQIEIAGLYGKQLYEARQHMVAELAAKNRSILQEIHRLRQQQQQQQQQQVAFPSQCLPEMASYQVASSYDSHATTPHRSSSMHAVVPCLRYSLVDELCHLRRRRDELEYRMVALQSSRLELVSQLEELMNVLKSRSTTPSTSPRSPMPAIDVVGPTLYAVSDDVEHAFAATSSHHLDESSSPLNSPISYRRLETSRDLLQATDYITDAVTSLVKELNSEDSADSGEERQADDAVKIRGEQGVDFLTELRQHRLFKSADQQQQQHPVPGDCRLQRHDRSRDHQHKQLMTADDVSDSCVETDRPRESYTRLDDEDQGSSDREEQESRVRWNNR